MRRRRQTILTALILLTAVGLTAAGLGTLLKREPAYYAAALPPTPADGLLAPVVITRSSDLKNDIRSKGEWGVTFTTEELNAFLREAFAPTGTLADVLPDNYSDPRVNIEGDRLCAAIRYGRGFQSTVLSTEIRLWLVKPDGVRVDPNTVAVEVVGVWAGGLPVGSEWALDWVTEMSRDLNINVNWFRHDGHPVGVFRFYADQTRAPTQIRRFAIGDDRITVAGRSTVELPTGGPLATSARDPE